MVAKFIGKDGSMGFKYGKIYNINSYFQTSFGKTCIIIKCKIDDTTRACGYDSVESLAENWVIL